MLPVLILAATMLQPQARAQGPSFEVRITSVNGEAITPSTITARPGDVVTFSADVFKVGGACKDAAGCPQSREIEEFDWQADNRPGNICQPSKQTDCLSSSDFQLNDYGVSFYVPTNIGNQVRITVSNASVGASATVILTNPDAAPQVNTGVNLYVYDSCLIGKGRWVYISGVRHWVPYTYQANWAPYQHGYWVWVEGDGMTWVSYDPWGFCTDHYGVWRHHLTYGWIWLPFPRPIYRPAVVSWYYGHNHIGWYPYYAGYPEAYRFGYRHGFNDGYWAGFQVTTLAVNRAGYTFGLTAVPNQEFAAKNIYAVRADDGVAAGIWGESARSGHITATPGGTTGPATRGWVEARLGEGLKTTQKQTVQVTGAALVGPVAVHSTPPYYQKLQSGFAAKNVVPVGSMVSGEGDRPTVTPPVAGGKSLTHAPVPPEGQEQRLAPRTRAPAVPRQDHPYAARLKLPKIQQPQPAPAPKKKKKAEK